MNNLVSGIAYGIVAQILTFLQLQGSVKYNWYNKYPIPVLLCAIPISWLFIKSVDNFIMAYNGELWASRFWGFSIGVIVFAVMGRLLFQEPFTIKTTLSILLSIAIICVQIFWK
jgi:multidrug transporter EmrE-like cation transporter